MTEILPIHPAGLSTPFGVWTTAISVEAPQQLVFISGLTARDEAGAVVGEGDMAAQTRQVCLNLQRTMEAAGGSLADIVSPRFTASGAPSFRTCRRLRRWSRSAGSSTNAA